MYRLFHVFFLTISAVHWYSDTTQAGALSASHKECAKICQPFCEKTDNCDSAFVIYSPPWFFATFANERLSPKLKCFKYLTENPQHIPNGLNIGRFDDWTSSFFVKWLENSKKYYLKARTRSLAGNFNHEDAVRILINAFRSGKLDNLQTLELEIFWQYREKNNEQKQQKYKELSAELLAHVYKRLGKLKKVTLTIPQKSQHGCLPFKLELSDNRILVNGHPIDSTHINWESPFDFGKILLKRSIKELNNNQTIIEPEDFCGTTTEEKQQVEKNYGSPFDLENLTIQNPQPKN